MGTINGMQLSELRDLIAQLAPRDGESPTAIPSLDLIRWSSSVTPDFRSIGPSLCLAVQGHEEVLLGEEERYLAEPDHHIVVSAALPVSARFPGATVAKPYLGLRLRLDLGSVRSVLEEARVPTPAAGATPRGLYVSRTAASLLDAVLRMVRLLRSPAEIPVLTPLIEREILYRLLLDESSAGLHRMAQADSPPQRISRAIACLKDHFRESLRVGDLAREAGMSNSSFHQRFRDLTGMSPLQYQKQLRLQEARKILRNERKDVGTVSRSVGYESPSQFSREYSRLFGNPPVREVSKVNSSLLARNGKPNRKVSLNNVLAGRETGGEGGIRPRCISHFPSKLLNLHGKPHKQT